MENLKKNLKEQFAKYKGIELADSDDTEAWKLYAEWLEDLSVEYFLTKNKFKVIANDFLVDTEEKDKTRQPWETRNHVPTLHSSLNEFYVWLDSNFWTTGSKPETETEPETEDKNEDKNED